MSNKEDINQLLARYFTGETLSLVQQQELDAWIASHQQEFEQMRRLMNAPMEASAEIHFDAGKAWQKIEPRLENRKRIMAFERKITFFLSVAASLLVLLGIGAFYLFRTPTEDATMYYANAENSVKQVLLPDSSEVMLYPEATLSYYYSDKGEGRMAALKGKAFFQVKKMHGIPFKVKTDFLDVEVLGTSFLVDVARKEKAGVFVKIGKVRVEAVEHEVVIQANEKAELKDGMLKTDTILRPQEVFNMDDSVLVFEQTPVTEVVKIIQEKTGIQIDLAKGLEKNQITTRINIDEPDIAGELAFLCGCKCETLVKGKHYRLYEK